MEAVQSSLLERDAILQKLRNKFLKAQNYMKQAVDKERRDVALAIGDWVYVKLRPYK